MNTEKVTREHILDEAKKCVCGQREQDYGSPESNFQIIADLWSAYTGHKYSPVDVANMMILLKLARIKNGGGTGDSFVDIAGYAACGGEINANADNSERSIPPVCEKCKHWRRLYNGTMPTDIYACVHLAPCGSKNNYAGFEPLVENKRDDECNTCCFGPNIFESPIDICNSCENHEFYTKSVDYVCRKRLNLEESK